jgi:hypothetical protein
LNWIFVCFMDIFYIDVKVLFLETFAHSSQMFTHFFHSNMVRVNSVVCVSTLNRRKEVLSDYMEAMEKICKIYILYNYVKYLYGSDFFIVFVNKSIFKQKLNSIEPFFILKSLHFTCWLSKRNEVKNVYHLLHKPYPHYTAIVYMDGQIMSCLLQVISVCLILLLEWTTLCRCIVFAYVLEFLFWPFSWKYYLIIYSTFTFIRTNKVESSLSVMYPNEPRNFG